MSNLSRRRALALVPAALVAPTLAACAQSGASPNLQQGAEILSAIATGASALEGVLKPLLPSATFAQVATWIASVQSAAQQVASDPTAAPGQSAIQTVATDVSDVLAALEALPLPAPASTIIAALAAAVPMLAAAYQIVVQFTAPTTASVRRRAPAPWSVADVVNILDSAPIYLGQR